MVTAEPPRRGLFKRVAYATDLTGDLFLSVHHDFVPDFVLEKWEFEGQERFYRDRFSGHSIFIANDNGARNASLLFGLLLGLQLKARGLRYTPHYTQAFMGYRRRDLLERKRASTATTSSSSLKKRKCRPSFWRRGRSSIVTRSCC